MINAFMLLITFSVTVSLIYSLAIQKQDIEFLSLNIKMLKESSEQIIDSSKTLTGLIERQMDSLLAQDEALSDLAEQLKYVAERNDELEKDYDNLNDQFQELQSRVKILEKLLNQKDAEIPELDLLSIDVKNIGSEVA